MSLNLALSSPSLRDTGEVLLNTQIQWQSCSAANWYCYQYHKHE